MAVRINLDSTIRYLNSVSADKLDGLLAAAVQKAADVSVKAAAPPIPETAANQAPTGNLAGILRFVASVTGESTAEDKQALAQLLGCLTARATAAGRVIPVPAVDETEQPVATRRRRRRG